MDIKKDAQRNQLSTMTPSDAHTLAGGLYEQLLTRALERGLSSEGLTAELGPVDDEEAHDVVAQYVEHMLAASFSTLRGEDAKEKQQRLLRKLLGLDERTGTGLGGTVSARGFPRAAAGGS